MIRCTLMSDTKMTAGVVVRVFGEQSFSDRDNEVKGLQLAYAAQCGTPLVAIFENGIVVGNFVGRTITFGDFHNPKIARYISASFTIIIINIIFCHIFGIYLDYHLILIHNFHLTS